jgi:hypothetical protein
MAALDICAAFTESRKPAVFGDREAVTPAGAIGAAPRVIVAGAGIAISFGRSTPSGSLDDDVSRDADVVSTG